MTGTVFFGSNEYAVGERDGFVSVTIVRTGDTSGAVHVSLATNPSSAAAGADYTAVHTVAVIAAGESSITVDIPIIDDDLSESTETFAVTIESIDSGTLLFPRNTVVKILDDENPVIEPSQPPLVSDYNVSVETIVTFPDTGPIYTLQPMSVVWLPGSDNLALVAHKKGQISIVNTETGEVADDFLIDLRDEVNSNSDRGLMDIAIHPDFENNPYLYAFYVVDPPGSAGTGGNAGEDGDGNRYAHVVRWELDLSGDSPALVPGSKTIILGAGGQSLADVSGNGLIDSTLAENIDLPSSEIDPDTGGYKQDYIKVDSITHAGGALAFGPDGMLYVSVGDGASFNLMDPRAVSVQDVDSLSGKILRVDPLTGQGLADNPFATSDLGANASKVWMLGLRNPFTMTFAEDGRLFMSETGWYTWEEINVGGAGSNFGWPYFEGADLGNLHATVDYEDLPEAAAFYSQVNAGDIVITPAYRAFHHEHDEPGFQVNAIVGASSIYTGNRYPSEFLNDYFFTDIVEGEIFAVDINDRTKVKFVADIGYFGPSHFVQGPDGYMYLLDLVGGRMMRLEIENETPTIVGGVSAAVTVAENTSVVTTIQAGDPDSITIVYTIDGGADAGKFQIDGGTGALSFRTTPDFEAPTDVDANNTYEVIVRASDGNTSDTQTIAVTVTNVNEAPVITSNGSGATASVSVAENTTAVTTVTATDPDAGATRTFAISGGADADRFNINASTGALTFKTAPDLEVPGDAGANNVYDVIVKVTDDASLTDTQTIAITVTSVNEAPVISSNGGGASASVSVAENTTAVTTVTATDPDAGATRTFAISGGADADRFNINASTGALTFKTAPDLEVPGDAGANNVYDVIVKVTDDAGLTDTQAIAVTVTGANEAPVISSNGGGSTASISVSENATAVTTVTATDPDAGATRVYALEGGADSAKFEIDANTGTLTFKAAPNFEAPVDSGANNVYDVIVKVTDNAGLTDTQAIAVTVTDLNEAPVISSNGGGSTASVSVSENATAVTTVTATDPDAGATRVYAIAGGSDAARFEIDANTGALKFKAAPNFEAPTDSGGNNVYEVIVKVTDNAGLTDTQAIAVTVTNVNEHTPLITSNGGGATATVSVAENTTAVTTVAATDADAGASLTYSITGGADRTKFTINASTGALSFVSAPDYEARADVGGDNVYDVAVQASDGSRTTSQSIAVTVTNVVETRPTITSNGGGATATIPFLENAVAVTTVMASQGDSGLPVTYAISGGADAAKFDINGSTGALTFKTAPNFELPSDAGGNNIYDVEVRATSGGLSDTQAIAVSVANANEAPKITSHGGQATAAISVKENVTDISTVTAIDPDASTTLTFAIVGGADAARFAIAATTGVLSFVNAANFEMPTDADLDNHYQVTVEVSDGVLVAQQTLLVAITDVPGKSVNGSKYRDTLRAAEGGESVVRGGNDDDVLLGTEWDEHLYGGKGRDKLYGGSGWDVLDGGPGKDLLVGGPHGDAFLFTSRPGKANVDKIKLFSPYYDRIELDIGVFPTLKVGVLEANAFHVGSTAADADDRIVYNLSSGALFYDRDGNGPARQVKFAMLANKPEKLHEGDFLVI